MIGTGRLLFDCRVSVTTDKARDETIPNLGCVDPKQGLPCVSMTESIYQYVLDQLESAKGTWPEVAEDTGVSRRTIEKIARREVKNPGVSHIETLASYFRARSKSAVPQQHA